VPTDKRRRRAPAATKRRRHPERTKEQILQAAVAEFSAHGYSGARVSRIAANAAVNAQLISYYFDGKAGLYQAVLERWREIIEVIPRSTQSIEETVAGFVATNTRNRDFARLLAWEALGDAPEAGEYAALNEQQNQRASFPRNNVENFRHRQAAGEIPEDIEPGHLLLALFAMASAPTVLPQIVRRILDVDPDCPEFQQRYAEQLVRLVRHLKLDPEETAGREALRADAGGRTAASGPGADTE
jgi:TetR/AcrR family transcriptional regulator